MRKTFRCYINIEDMLKTTSGKRKVWRTDNIPTHCCSLDVLYFVWEKASRENHYNPYSCYVSLSQITFIDIP